MQASKRNRVILIGRLPMTGVRRSKTTRVSTRAASAARMVFGQATDSGHFGCTTSRLRRNFALLQLMGAAVAIQILLNLNHAMIVSGARIETNQVTMDASSSSRSGAAESEIEQSLQEDNKFATISVRTLNGKLLRRTSRQAVRDNDSLWPNATVPYTLYGTFTNESWHQLNEAFEEFHRYTCIRFRRFEPTNDRDYVKITQNSYECASSKGRQGGSQSWYLPPRCTQSKPYVLRQVGYVIGLLDEHCRPDRDDYVTIRFENVVKIYRPVFNASCGEDMDTHGTPYDYLSIMHLDEYAYSENRQRVIETKNTSYQTIIGKSIRLSFRDAKLANIMYKCSELNGCKNVTCPGEGFVGKDCRCWCASRDSNVTAEHCPDMLTSRQDIEDSQSTYKGTSSSTSGVQPTVSLLSYEQTTPSTSRNQLKAQVTVGHGVISTVVSASGLFSVLFIAMKCCGVF